MNPHLNSDRRWKINESGDGFKRRKKVTTRMSSHKVRICKKNRSEETIGRGKGKTSHLAVTATLNNEYAFSTVEVSKKNGQVQQTEKSKTENVSSLSESATGDYRGQAKLQGMNQIVETDNHFELSNGNKILGIDSDSIHPDSESSSIYEGNFNPVDRDASNVFCDSVSITNMNEEHPTGSTLDDAIQCTSMNDSARYEHWSRNRPLKVSEKAMIHETAENVIRLFDKELNTTDEFSINVRQMEKTTNYTDQHIPLAKNLRKDELVQSEDSSQLVRKENSEMLHNIFNSFERLNSKVLKNQESLVDLLVAVKSKVTSPPEQADVQQGPLTQEEGQNENNQLLEDESMDGDRDDSFPTFVANFLLFSALFAVLLYPSIRNILIKYAPNRF